MIIRPLIRNLIRSPLERGNSSLRVPAANMEAWYRKGLGITSAANAVSQWADQTVNARHLLQATGANQPTLQGDQTILFDGTSDFLKASFALVQPATIYLRVKQVTWTIGGRILDGGGAANALVVEAGTTPRLDMNAGSTTNTNLALAVNTWGSLAVVFNGVGSILQVDATTSGPADAGPNAPGGLTLGADRSGTSLWSNIQVAEAIVYSVAHDAATRAQVIAYLNTL